LNCRFLIFSANSIPLIVTAAARNSSGRPSPEFVASLAGGLLDHVVQILAGSHLAPVLATRHHPLTPSPLRRAKELGSCIPFQQYATE